MRLFTIGFTKTTAEHFFKRLKEAGVQRLLDTRINRDGQLSGFAKATDLEFFLKQLVSIEYVAEPSLAPTAELLKSYRDKSISWTQYEDAYRDLLVTRKVESLLAPSKLDNACLLCSEPTPTRCHRRLASEYLRDKLGSDMFTISHL